MEIDPALYRKEIPVSAQPLVRLSVIDIAPEHPKRTLVFVHGFGGKAVQWQYQLQDFSTANRVIALDIRGHGHSDKPRAGYSMTQIQLDLETVLDTLGVTDKIVLIGHSFGGAIVTEFAANNPARIDRLILIASAGEYKLNPLYRFLLNLPHSTLQAIEPFTHNWLGAPPYVLKEWYTEILSRWNGWELLRSLQMPVLVIRGHLDAVFEKPLFEEVARVVPDAEEVDVGASGHMVMLERRAAVNRSITRFIDTDKRYWSQSEGDSDDTQRAQLLEERPWLPYYDEGVPLTIAVPNVPLHSLLFSAARRFRKHIALIFEGKRISYQRLHQESISFANALDSLGVQKGDRVMLILPNIPQQVIAFNSISKIGAVTVFALPTTNPEELIRQIQDSGSSVLITLPRFNKLLRQIKTDLESKDFSPLKHIIFTQISDYLPLLKRLALKLSGDKSLQYPIDSSFDASVHDFCQIQKTLTKSGETPEIEISPKDLAVIQYTGGTTANPKGVMLSHYNLVANALQTRHWIPNVQAKQERFLCVLPFAHSYGLTAALNVPVTLGATLILKMKFDVADILHTIQKYRPTIFPGVPQMYVAIEDFPGVRKFGIDSIRACISGSAPLPVEVQEAFEKRTRGKLVEGYGLTEASPVTHANPLNGLRKVGRIGLPLPSTEARIVDLLKSKHPVPSGQIGELAVRGPQVMMGYWNNPEATQEVITRDGWLLTGDIAQVDTEGYFRIIARKADMWYPNKPGDPAFPRDLEEVLFEIPQVKEAAVVAVAGQPIAFIIPKKERPPTESVIAYCKRRLPPELVPRLVIFVDDFPRTLIGKVLRRELAKHIKENQPEFQPKDIKEHSQESTTSTR